MIKPVGCQVLLKPVESESDTDGGIVIPETAKQKDKQSEYTVMRLGMGGNDENGNPIVFSVKPGDTVLTNKYGGTNVKVNGEEFKIAKQSDILAIIRRNGNE
jgi:chaperonin GroES